MSEPKKRTENDVIASLRLRFSRPQFAFLRQVANETGFCKRWADAVAISVWPSRGHDIHGIEVKVSRSDWLHEMRNPAKSEPVQKFCNRWWLAVASDKIVDYGELPPTWGLLVMSANGKMRCVTDAPPLNPLPLNASFMAAILRKWTEADDANLTAQYDAGVSAGRKAAMDARGAPDEVAANELKHLRESLAQFQKASGLDINTYNGQRIGEAVRAVETLKAKTNFARFDLDQMTALVKAMEKMKAEIAGLLKPSSSDSAVDAVAP